MPKARAVRIKGAGGIEVLELGELEVREPGPNEVLVEVAAAGLNRADVLQRMGFYPAPKGAPPDVPGLEFAGVVAAVGSDVETKMGARVMGIVAGGGMATHLVAHERELLPVPEGMSLEDAAAVPEAFLTAYDALFLQGGLGMGQVALIHAVASGVGTAALQLVRASGATAIGTLRSRDKLERVKALGIEHVLCVEDAKFADEVLALAPRGADVVLDLVGGRYLADDLRAVAPRGFVVIVGLLAGARTEIDLGTLLRRRVRLHGTVLRSRPVEERIALARAFERDVIPLFNAGSARPVIDEVLPMSEIREAHRRMGENATFGKIVLRW
jgi:putative PIG3 family NAD(P)H quinone oxidoreductase